MRKRAFALASLLFSLAVPSFASFKVAAWIPPWDQNALTTVQQNGGAIQESNPVWYSLNADGTIAKNWNAENPTWRAAMTGSRLLPTVQNIVNHAFSGSTGAAAISPSSREAHADAIAQLAVLNAFDGIDIDYERLPASSRADFTAFVQLLAQKLHAANKKLSVTVYSKTSDRAMGNGGDAEDYAAIGAAADSVKIMAYDYHGVSTDAGDVSPIDWLDQVATYATSRIASSKVMIGLPWYGYDWSSAGAKTVTYSSATQTAQNNGVNVSHSANGEATYSYSGHTVFFQDASSYEAKVQMLLTKHGSIAGIAHWAAGNEDPTVWSYIKAGFSIGSPATPPPPAPQTPKPAKRRAAR